LTEGGGKEVGGLVAKARQTVATARHDADGGYYAGAVSRAYYAAFYIAEALLLSKGETYKTHKGVIAAFGKTFVKTGEFPARFQKFLNDAFRVRMKADYETYFEITRDEVQDLVREAEAFLAAAEEYLKKG
jgi:uncharacterized protein (UPF0332 family)